MLTVPQAAARVGRNPETIRRWIRAGRLRSERVGTQHLVDESELDTLVDEPADIVPPGGWGTLPSGEPAPNWAQLVREAREGH
jgi:excisionase family DNA binding protein